MDEMNNVNTEQPQKAESQTGERLFTQAEVDKIIKDRLSRVRSAAPKEPTEAEIRDRELTARESRLSCREYLLSNGYPAELLDVIDTSDYKAFCKKADTVAGLTRAKQRPEPMRSTEPVIPSGKGFDTAKHKPRQFPPYN